MSESNQTPTPCAQTPTQPWLSKPPKRPKRKVLLQSAITSLAFAYNFFRFAAVIYALLPFYPLINSFFNTPLQRISFSAEIVYVLSLTLFVFGIRYKILSVLVFSLLFLVGALTLNVLSYFLDENPDKPWIYQVSLMILIWYQGTYFVYIFKNWGLSGRKKWRHKIEANISNRDFRAERLAKSTSSPVP